MNKDWVLTQEAFDKLLAWLDPNRDQAGKKYEEIRLRLIKIFTCRGCMEPEALADETINRVISKLETIVDSYTGDPALYFYGVAHKVHLEYLRKKPAPPAPAPPPLEPEDGIEPEYDCLEHCIERLTRDNRELVLQYYQEEKQAKINHRKRLAEQLGIALNALRIRAFRIRAELLRCVQDCLEQRAVG
jgi:DNA-directed RNA polymerase specialized sigma24 family protein